MELVPNVAFSTNNYESAYKAVAPFWMWTREEQIMGLELLVKTQILKYFVNINIW